MKAKAIATTFSTIQIFLARHRSFAVVPVVFRFTRNPAIPEVCMSEFQLVTRFEPAGDQPEAIR